MSTKKITISPNIIEHLGSDLITSPDVAFVELIKNSLDASLDNIGNEIHVGYYESIHEFSENSPLIEVDEMIKGIVDSEYSNKPFFTIEDLGCGMDEKTIETGFLSIGTDIKKHNKNSNKIILGEKGIGRLATQRLGEYLIVESASESEEFSNILAISWKELLLGNDISSIDIPYFRGEKKSKSYTRLWIFGVNSTDMVKENAQIELFKDISTMEMNEDLDNAVSFLISPFHNKVRVPELRFFYRGYELAYGINTEIFSFAETIHSFNLVQENSEMILKFNLDIRPWYLHRIHKANIKPRAEFSKYEKETIHYENLLDKYKERFDATFNISIPESELIDFLIREEKRNLKLSSKEITKEFDFILYQRAKRELSSLNYIAPVRGQVYSYKKDSAYFKTALKFTKDNTLSIKEMQSIVDKYNGVKLYRDQFRIGFLGNKDNDWLKFQQYRSLGQQFYRFNLGTTLGEVVVNDPKQHHIQEVSSRLEINRNQISNTLLDLLEKICNIYFFKFNTGLNDMIKTILFDEGWLQGNTKQKLIIDAKKNTSLEKQNKDLKKKLIRTKDLLQNLKVTNDGFRMLTNEQYSDAIETIDSVEKQIDETDQYIKSSKSAIDEATAGLDNIEIEAFNNYKLMANGLITETITHELHSVINQDYNENVQDYFELLSDYLMKESMPRYNNQFLPIRDTFNSLLESINGVSDLYNFLESTFIRNNSKDEYEQIDVQSTISDIDKRLSTELGEQAIDLVAVDIDQKWYLPKGVLLHVLYNLINNSKYWVDIRRKRALKDAFYINHGADIVTVEGVGIDSIVVYDTGTGVKKEMEYVLFEPLQSGKGPDGRGMGLYIVKKLMISFGGDIELLEERNEYGNRYKFMITVPESSYERGI